MNVNRLRAEYAAKIGEARRMGESWRDREDQMPQSVADSINGLLGDSDLLRAKLEIAEKLEKGVSFAQQPTEVPLAWRAAGPSEGEVPVDRKSWRRLDVQTAFGPREVRYFVPLNIERKEKQYASAFEAYLTKRYASEIGPSDAKALAEGTDAAGGFMIPPDFQAQVIRKSITLTQIRPNATVSSTSRDAQSWPKINYSTDDLYASAVRLSWTGEAPASSTVHRVTDPLTGLYTVPVHTAMASIPLSNDLLEDAAVDVAGLASDLFAEAFALGEEAAFVSGNGISQPMGLLSEIGTNGPAFLTTAGVGVISGDDLIKLFYSVPVQYRARGKWLMSSSTLQTAELLKDGQGRYLVSSMLQASLQTPQLDMLKGKPILIDEFMPAIASGNYPLLYGDFSGYLVLDRVGLSVQRLTEIYAELNVTLLLGRKRVGGYCIRPWQIRAAKVQ